MSSKQGRLSCPVQSPIVLRSGAWYHHLMSRSRGAEFGNIVLTGCRLNGRRDGAIVEVDACRDAAEAGRVVLRDVTFLDNRLKGNASAVFAASAACTSVEMRDVRFENNACSGICFAHLSSNNSLRSVKMEGNTRIVDADLVHVLISLPPGSATVASELVARRNGMTVVGGNGSALNLTHSQFRGNANDSVITLSEAAGVLISNCSFSRNLAAVSSGAAMEVVQSEDVRISRCRFDRNAAAHGGAIAVSESALRLENTVFRNNNASANGGALYVKDSAVDIHRSQFSGNRARLGGAISAPGNHAEDSLWRPVGALHSLSPHSAMRCSTPEANCTFVALIGTRFTHNSASAGGALFISDPGTVRYNCSDASRDSDLHLYSGGAFDRLEVLDASGGCPDWTENEASLFGDLMASYARALRPFVRYRRADPFKEWNSTVLRINDYRSGDTLPSILLTVVDGFGQGPVRGTGNASVEAIVRSEEQFFAGSIRVLIDDGEAEISGIAGFQLPGVYRVNIDFSEDVFPTRTIVISVRDCTFGESRQANGTLCSPCSETEFNFDADQACQACPENGDCSIAMAIQPRSGYWHSTPCSQTIQECPIREACDYEGRKEQLLNATGEIDRCTFNETFLQQYRADQCERVRPSVGGSVLTELLWCRDTEVCCAVRAPRHTDAHARQNAPNAAAGRPVP